MVVGATFAFKEWVRSKEENKLSERGVLNEVHFSSPYETSSRIPVFHTGMQRDVEFVEPFKSYFS